MDKIDLPEFPPLEPSRKKFLFDKFKVAAKENPIMAKIRKKLLAVGGREVCFNWKEEDAENILKRGEVFSPEKCRMVKGARCECHDNSRKIFLKSPNRMQLATGYSLSEDGVWRQHSWVWDSKREIVVETTTRRVAYFGFRMTIDEGCQFCSQSMWV